MKSEYLLFNLLIGIAPSLGMVLYGRGKWPNWVGLLGGYAAISIPYIIWDYFVTNWWWYFNPMYTLGITVGTLPIEEILFFFVIPWSCLVIWINLRDRIQRIVTWHVEWGFFTLSMAIGIWSYMTAVWYTAAVCVVIALITVLSWFTEHWLCRKSSLLFLAVVSVLTLVFNGYLTWRPVVVYNSAVMTNLRIGTVPVEDFFYGLGLLCGIVMVYEVFERRLKKSP